MGKADTKTKEFWRNNARFADLFNTVLFGGQRVLRAEDLQEKDSDLSATVPLGSGRKYTELLAKASDVVKKQAFGVEFAIFTIQNQSRIDYSMPVREFADNALIYLQECREISERNRAQKKAASYDEFFSIGKDDRIHAVISLTIYYGETPWDGPRSLHDMLADMPEELERVVPDYPLHLVEVRSSDRYTFSHPDVETLFSLIRCIYSKDMESEALRSVRPDIAETVGQIVRSKRIVTLAKKSREGGNINMCQALREMMQDSRNDGIQQGIQEAYKVQIRKKLVKNRTPVQIAEELELELPEVQEIIELIRKEQNTVEISV